MVTNVIDETNRRRLALYKKLMWIAFALVIISFISQLAVIYIESFRSYR